MENKTVFKIGDRVYHHDKNWVEIADFKECGAIVKNKQGVCSFLPFHELSFTEYDFVNGGFSQERPIEVPKRGQIVWVRNQEKDPWVIRHFVGMDGKMFECSQAPIATFGKSYKYLTTINPY